MRDILHCDLNNFFASVECLNRPELKNVPMAVCGDPNARHGIILAKNEIAKKLGIVTAETVFSAQKKCNNLVLVQGNYTKYYEYSKIVNEIYLKYTDRVEPFGIDESFLDITESKRILGTPMEIAYKIKEEVKEKTGLTISVGVSFNKALAKLGSDLKKPDAITELSIQNYKKKIYNLPVSMLLYVGKNTYESLKKIGIYTIGDLAMSDKYKLIKKIGKLGNTIHNYANGIDDSEVKKYTDEYIPKSISKGETFSSDVKNIEVIESKIKELLNFVIRNLRKYNLKATCVNLVIKDSKFNTVSRQTKIDETDDFQVILKNLKIILKENYFENYDVRSVTIGVSNLVNKEINEQVSLFDNNFEKDRKKEKINKVLENINNKYKKDIVNFI